MKEKSIKIITIIVFAVCLVFALCACTTIPDKYDITIAGDGLSDKCADVPENEPHSTKQYLATVVDSTGQVRKIEYDYDSTIVYPVVEREGYTFTGWKIVVDGVVGDNFTLTKMPDYNITCRAQWQIKRFTVTFIAGADVTHVPGSSPLVQTVDWGTTAVAPNLVKTGYHLNGWTGGVITAPVTANIELTPVWEINTYTVTFNIGEGKRVGGGELVQQVEHGKKIILPVVERVGYNYQFGTMEPSGIDDSETFVPVDENTVVTGTLNYVIKYTLKQYTVTFKNYDGSTLFVKQIGHGFTVTADNPTRKGYTFSGWDKPLTNIVGDTIITAKFTVNKYTIDWDSNGGTFVQ
ncbi:MAG: InlB B-repeat-containing protein [Clostridia bacterium]